jgi:hypothetical protein
MRWDRDAIRTLETERASLTTGDPKIRRLTEQIEGLALRVREEWAAEGELLAELRTLVDEAGTAPGRARRHEA